MKKLTNDRTNNRTKKYHGVVVPMITPFNEDGSIDESGASRVTEFLLENGVYPFILGTTGESASIPESEKLRYVEAVAKAVNGRTTLYAGISRNCLANAVEASKRYADLGVDVVVAHLPSYYPISKDYMLGYYEMLSERIPLPLVVYNILATTHHSIPLEVVEILSHHPNIVGLKDSERDEDRLKRAVEMWGERADFAHFVGWGAKCTDALLMGSDGIVPSTGNITPKMFHQLYTSATNSHPEDAKRLQAETDAVAELYQKGKLLSESLAALKVMMKILGLCESWVLPPLQAMSSEAEKELLNRMQGFDVPEWKINK